MEKKWVVCEQERGTARCKFLAKYETEEEAMRDYESRKEQYEPTSSCYLAVFNLDDLDNR